MKTSLVSQKYAKALFEVAKASGRQAVVLEEMRALASALGQGTEGYRFFSSAASSKDQKRLAIQETLKTTKVSDETANLLRTLSDRDRLAYVEEILVEYQMAIDEDNRVVRGEVRSATPLDLDQRKKVEEKVSSVTGKKALLEYTEDPAILGGLVAQVGSYKFDDSLETQLIKLEDRVKRRAH